MVDGDNVSCLSVKYVNPFVFDDAGSIMHYADMSSNDMGNMFHAFFYGTLNGMVEEGGYEDISKHDLAILTDLVSDPIGTDTDEAGTKLYPELYMFSDHVTIKGENDE